MDVGAIKNVNAVDLKSVEKVAQKEVNVNQADKKISDLQGMDALVGASQVKQVLHVGPGSPILAKAASIISKDGPAQLKIATEPGSVMDVWSGRDVPYDAGDVVMYYGTYDFDNEYIHDNAKAKFKDLGEPCVHDYNRSVDPDLMRETYVDKATGKYLIETGQLEAGMPPVDAIKRAKGGCLIMPAGTKVHTLETIKHNLPPVEVAPGQVVALDHKGNPYVQDISQMLKRNKPTDAKSEQMFEMMKDFVQCRNELSEEYGANTPAYDTHLKDAWAEFSYQVNKRLS